MYLGDEGDDLVKSCRTKVKFCHFAHSFKPSICADYASIQQLFPIFENTSKCKNKTCFKKKDSTQ